MGGVVGSSDLVSGGVSVTAALALAEGVPVRAVRFALWAAWRAARLVLWASLAVIMASYLSCWVEPLGNSGEGPWVVGSREHWVFVCGKCFPM